MLAWFKLTQPVEFFMPKVGVAICMAMIFGTPFAASKTIQRVYELDSRGPFSFHVLFKLVLIPSLWVTLISIGIFLALFGGDGSLFELLNGGPMIIFGIITIIAIFSLPVVLWLTILTTGLFRVIALETVPEKSDKSSWEEAL